MSKNVLKINDLEFDLEKDKSGNFVIPSLSLIKKASEHYRTGNNELIFRIFKEKKQRKFVDGKIQLQYPPQDAKEVERFYPQLQIGGHTVALRQVNELVYTIRQPESREKVYKALVEPEEKQVKEVVKNGSKFRVCIVTNNCENKIETFIEDLQAKMKGLQWSLFIGDNGSVDSTFEKIKNKPKTCFAKPYHAFQFEYEKDAAKAEQRLGLLSDSCKKDFPFKINFYIEEDKEVKNHSIESFCSVANKSRKEEVLALALTLRAFHDQPLYLVCDEETKTFLGERGAKNVEYITSITEENTREIKEKHFSKPVEDMWENVAAGKYFSPECIYKKMEAMEHALKKHENTFFLDSDILIIESLQDNFQNEIVLSPNYVDPKVSSHSKLYGFFNAGYIFCANKTFPEFWRSAFLNRSKFFEQECLNYIAEKYDVGTFSEKHNYGWWRMKKNEKPKIKDVKSIHVHLFRDLDKTLEEENKFQFLSKTKSLRYAARDLLWNKPNFKNVIEVIRSKEWGTDKQDFSKEKSNSNAKINLGTQITFNSHRSGWAYCIEALAPLHNDKGILFDGFIENNFSWEGGEGKVYDEPWVGFVHNPPNQPKWWDYQNSIESILGRDKFKESLKNCLGLFSLSEYLSEYLRKKLNVPVSTLIHPTEIPDNIFDPQKFKQNSDKKVIQIGYWLRKINSIYSLPLDSKKYTKVRLVPTGKMDKYFNLLEKLRETEAKEYNIQHDPIFFSNTKLQGFLENDEYDEWLTKNITFVDLYDSSANNAVIESIARGTPLLVNPLPAVVEYLGKDYPFYFNNLEEAAKKAENFELVEETHHYLLNCEARKKFSQEAFRKDLEESKVYKSL